MIQSLRSRLVLSTLLITLLGFVVVVVVFTRSLPVWSSQEKQRELKAQAHRFAGQVTQLYRRGGSSRDLEGRLGDASQILHERIIIERPSGKIAFDSGRKTPFYKSINPRLSPQDLKSPRAVTTFGPGNLITFRSPIQGTHGHRNGGTVVLIARAADLQPGVSSLLNVSLIAAGTALVVWLLIALFFTYSVGRPLLHITEATRRMARGDYSTRVQATGHGELAQLATVFNEMAEQVQMSYRTLKDFLANVSHDLRTPLTMITGFSQALLDGTAGPDETESSAAVIHQEATKMQRLVDDLMQLTRLESGLFMLERHPVDARSLAQGAIDHVRRVHGDSAVPGLQNQVPADTSPILVDPDRFERVLRNLLDNAVRYTPTSGAIAVNARQAGDGWIEIGVSDTGSGIAAADLPRVFERFYRSDKGRDRAHGHSGLGLAIVREIVEAHGGQVAVESEPGRGTTFRLTVPAAPARARHRASSGEPVGRAITR